VVGEEGLREEWVLDASCGGDEGMEGGAEMGNHSFQVYYTIAIIGSGSVSSRGGCFWCFDRNSGGGEG